MITDEDLRREEQQLIELQKGLSNASSACDNILSHLDKFEDMFKGISHLVLPLHRNLEILNRVHGNVESTVELVTLLEEQSDLAKREETILEIGINFDNLAMYIKSLDTLQEALKTLNMSDLTSCRITMRRLESALKIAIDNLIFKYKEWFVQWIEELDSTSNDASLLEALKLISESMRGKGWEPSIIKEYSRLQSKRAMEELRAILKEESRNDNLEFFRALSEYKNIVKREDEIAANLLSTDQSKLALMRIHKNPLDLIFMTAEACEHRVQSLCKEGNFLSATWIFQLLEASLPLQDRECEPSIKLLVKGCVAFLKSFSDWVRSEERGKESVSANATIYPMTSIVINSLKAIFEHSLLIEGILVEWAKPNWDGRLGEDVLSSKKDTGLDTFRVYTKDVLDCLVNSVQSASQSYRHSITSILFQLNNFHYIKKALSSEDTGTDYSKIVQDLLNEYLKYWSQLGKVLEGGGRDEFKAFAKDLGILHHSQSACAVPDSQLRMILIAQIKDRLIPAYNDFYNQYGFYRHLTF